MPLDAFPAVYIISGFDASWPIWIEDAIRALTIVMREGKLVLKTVRGRQVVDRGDWLIKGISGAIFAVDGATFNSNYQEFIE